MRILVCLLFLSACTHRATDSAALQLESNQQPVLVFRPVKDEACTYSSAKIAHLLTSSTRGSLSQRKPLLLSQEDKGARYLIEAQLIELQESEDLCNELSMSALIKVVDRKLNKVLLQEVLSVNTLLEEPLRVTAALSSQQPEFRITPLGLSIAKLSRKMTSRIEESILSQSGRAYPL